PMTRTWTFPLTPVLVPLLALWLGVVAPAPSSAAAPRARLTPDQQKGWAERERLSNQVNAINRLLDHDRRRSGRWQLQRGGATSEEAAGFAPTFRGRFPTVPAPVVLQGARAGLLLPDGGRASRSRSPPLSWAAFDLGDELPRSHSQVAARRPGVYHGRCSA